MKAESMVGQVLLAGVAAGAGLVVGYLIWGGGGADELGEMQVEREVRGGGGGRESGRGAGSFERGERDGMQREVLSGKRDLMGLLEERLGMGSMSPTDLLGDVQALAEVASSEELEAMFVRFKGSSGRPDYTGPILENWARVDPAGAVAFFVGENDYASKERLGRVHAVWSKSDPSVAMSSALALADPDVRRSSVEHVLSFTANDRPRLALEMASTLDPPLVKKEWLQEHVFAKWGRDAPEDAAAEIASMGSSTLRREAVEGLAAGWGKDDPEAALAWAEALGGTLRNLALQRIVPELAKSDPQRAWDLGETLPGGYETERVKQEIAKAMFESAPEAAVDLVMGMPPGRMRSEVLGAMVRQMAVGEPGAAAGLLFSEQTTRDEQHSLIGTLMSVWSENDFGGALAWADGREDDTQRMMALQVVAMEWAKRSPGEALEYVEALGDGSARQRMTREVFVRWGMDEPMAALAAAGGLGGGDERRLQAAEAVMQSWGRGDPDAAAAYLSGAEEGATKTRLTVDLVQSWSEIDPPAAAAWFSGNADVDEYVGVVDALVNRWMRHDMFGASEWVARLPRGKGKDKAVDELLGELRDDPEAMVLWVQEIEDTELKERWLRAIPGFGE